METMEAFARKTAEKAARQVGSSLVEFFRRDKSRAYLVGKLMKQFPDRGGNELKQFVEQLRHVISEEPGSHEVPQKRTRKPVRGRESLSDNVWADRVSQLAEILLVPYSSQELEQISVQQLGIDHNLFTQVLGAAEQQGVIEYDSESRRWRSTDPPPEEIPDDPEANPVELQLPVELHQEERYDAYEEAGELTEREVDLRAKISELRRELRTTQRRKGERLLLARRGTEQRPVHCEERRDFKSRQVLIIRMDTFEVVKRRAMTSQDTQIGLKLGA